MNEINLYIPTGVKAENELFNGFGKRFWRSQQIFPYRMIDEWGMKKGA